MTVENRARTPSIARCSCSTLLFVIALSALFFVIYYFTNASTNSVSDINAQYAISLRLTTRHSIEKMQQFARESALTAAHPKLALYTSQKSVSYEQLATGNIRFNIDGVDVLVFLHIQKTAGTSFEKFLVSHLNTTRPCRCDDTTSKRCKCFRPRTSSEVWLFSRYSTGWQCGLHADFTELFVSGCVERAMNKLESMFFVFVNKTWSQISHI